MRRDGDDKEAFHEAPAAEGAGARRKGGSVFSIIRRLTRQGDDACERGQALVEYALILTVVALITAAALESIGGSVSQFISQAAAGVSGG